MDRDSKKGKIIVFAERNQKVPFSLFNIRVTIKIIVTLRCDENGSRVFTLNLGLGSTMSMFLTIGQNRTIVSVVVKSGRSPCIFLLIMNALAGILYIFKRKN